MAAGSGKLGPCEATVRQFPELIAAFFGQYRGAGLCEAVLPGIPANGCFGFGGLGAGTPPSLAAIGLGLLVAGRSVPPATG